MSDVQPKEEVLFSNVSIVRDPDGRLAMYVGSEKIIGQIGLNLQPTNEGGMWTIGIPSNRVRLSERVPAQPMYQGANVVPFTRPATGNDTNAPQASA